MSCKRFKSFTSRKLSWFRTEHSFEHYAEFRNVVELGQLVEECEARDLKYIVLGNGSNVFFKRKTIKTAILMNKIPSRINQIGNNEFLISSGTPVSEVLNFCFRSGRDCFYYLSSVPATVGGALAMNAGGGPKTNESIYTFVTHVTSWNHERGLVKRDKKNIPITYRTTPFGGLKGDSIIEARFLFSPIPIAGNPIENRRSWAKQHQDNTLPNCGSTFKKCDLRIMRRLQGFKLGGASLSKKTIGWVLNTEKNPKRLRQLLLVVKIVHILMGKKCELEVVSVE